MAELTDGELVENPGSHDVEVEMGFTKSMGEKTYEFIRTDIRYRGRLTEGQNHDQLADELYQALEEKLVEKVNEIDKALGPRGRTSQIHSNKG